MSVTFECDACGVKWWPPFPVQALTRELNEAGWLELDLAGMNNRPRLLCGACRFKYEETLVPAIDAEIHRVRAETIDTWLATRRDASGVLADLDLRCLGAGHGTLDHILDEME